MTNYDHLIVGGGMTAAAAADGIREVDASGSIGIVSAEPEPPYNRPPLSKGLWKGDRLDTIWRHMNGEQPKLHLGCTIKKIVPEKKQVIDTAGGVFSYRNLLLATGGTPRRLPFNDEEIIYFRTLSDYQRLRGLAETGRRFAIIGGGFIGSEIAAALAANGKSVVLIFPGQEIGERLFPHQLAAYVSSVYRQKGVELLAGEKITSSEARGKQRILKTGSGREIIVDAVIAGIGIQPNIELPKAAGVGTANGILVDELLRTSVPGIYAAGDVAEFYNRALEKRMRVEHEDNANSMGRQAGRNMAGLSEPYDHLPSFYSDMFELGYEAVGELDSGLETFADWKRPNDQGVVYYLRHGRVRGVLLWNVWGQVEAARELIAQPGPFSAEDLRGRLPANAKSGNGETMQPMAYGTAG
jgi:3-phenylpropionate/trans-cinnamate dioxygenase ferredoxin reductase component